MSSSRAGGAAMLKRIDDWQDALDFAAGVVTDVPVGPEAHHYRSLARRLVAAAVWHVASESGSSELDAAQVRRIVGAELPADSGDVADRPLSRSSDPRVRAVVDDVRRNGRSWVKVEANEQNAAAWMAMQCLAGPAGG
ncbi:hypothetical protein ABT297_17140 [Dactylosporangium sp. NPDC000555]|uniref:hypothetical protein n=1 Tax=Dactylosporangium sp. NPDC000555 TaxID=3154260 RepID=UPI003323F500